MADEPVISIPSIGLNLNSDPINLKQGQYTYAMGATLSHRSGGTPFIGNIEGNIPVVKLPQGFMIVGHVLLNRNDTALLLKSYSGDCQIGIFYRNRYTMIASDPKLGFSINHTIQVKYKINSKGERIIYWTDNNKPPMWMNLDKPTFIKILNPDGCTYTTTTELDLDFMRIFKAYNRPCIVVDKVTEHGRLPSAGYFITGQYADANSNGLTAWFPMIGPIPIYKDPQSQAFASITGIKSGERTSKAIHLTFSDVDISFSHMNIGIVRVTNGVKESFRVATISTGLSEYLYTGAGNTEVPVLLTEMIQPAVVYTRAKTIDATTSELLLGNLRSEKEFNFQPFISKVQVNWQVFEAWSDDTKNSFKDPAFAAYMRVFRQDEVYALGVVLEMTDGTETRGWHIPGRRMDTMADGNPFPAATGVPVDLGISADFLPGSIQTLDPVPGVVPGSIITISGSTIAANNGTFTVASVGVTNLTGGGTFTMIRISGTFAFTAGSSFIHIHSDPGFITSLGYAVNPAQWDSMDMPFSVDRSDILQQKRYQMYNTALITGSSSTGSDTGLSYYGEMGYHESTEKYDCDVNIWGADAGKPIRHHRFPSGDILHIHDGKDMNRAYNERVKLRYMGVKLPNIDDVIASLPDEIRSKVKSWRLVVGDRTYNKTVVASGMMLNARKQNWRYDGDAKDDIRFFPNYPLNDLRTDQYFFHARPDFEYGNYFFHSPDTHFKKTFLSAGELRVVGEIYGKTDSYHQVIEPYPQFEEKDGDNDVAALQAVSIGWYNNFRVNKMNNHLRPVQTAIYIPFNSRVSSGIAAGPVFNLFRESSVFLNFGGRELDKPTKEDNSRIMLNDADGPNPDIACGCVIRNRERDCSAYYGILKTPLPNQYGSIFDIRYNDTYPCGPAWLPKNIVFGGDTFIGQFTMKTQHAFFQNIDQFVGAEDGMADVDFQAAETLPHMQYFYRNRNVSGNPRDQSSMMCEDNSPHGFLGIGGDGSPTDLGNLTLMMFGIPQFWAESDYNIALRHSGEVLAETFYPDLNKGSFKMSEWLSVNALKFDNSFLVNEDYSAKNDIKLIESLSPLFDPITLEDAHYSTRVIKSLPSQPEDINDNWLHFKPLDYHDLPKGRGELQDIRYLGNYRTSFRMEKGFFMDVLYSNLGTSDGAISLGSGKLFEKELQEKINTDGGYVGTCAQFAFNLTPAGAFFVSPDSGKAYLISDNIEDIGNDCSIWLQENLPLILASQLNVPSKDNAINPEGIGFLSVWDPKQEMWFLTKRDYSVIDPANIGRLQYKDGKLYLDTTPVSLNNKTLFENKSWTFAYNPPTKSWISWQPFIPNFYLIEDLEMYSGQNSADTDICKHNIDGVYNTFYGKQYPYIVEGVMKPDGVNTYVNPTVTFISRMMGVLDKDFLATFNKAILYNLHQCSGVLNLIIQDENDLSSLYAQLTNTNVSRDVSLRWREGHFNFSDYYDIIKDPATHFFTDNWLASADYRNQYPIDKVILQTNMDYDKQENDYGLLRDRWLKYRLILDNRHDLKLLLALTTMEVRPSIT